MTMLKRTFLTALLLFGASSSLFAQATATVNGRVIDQDELVLPGVIVIATNTATGATRETLTNASGLYTVPALTPGTYDVRAELPGFAAQTRRVELVTSSTLTVDFQLGIAQLEETITVSGQAPLIEVTQAVVAHSIRQEEVRELPMINRSLAAMMTLLPGAREVEAGGSHGHASNYVSFAATPGAATTCMWTASTTRRTRTAVRCSSTAWTASRNSGTSERGSRRSTDGERGLHRAT